jgi:hypothetical protein
MKVLVVGDSFTAGDELPDYRAVSGHRDVTSKFAWPALLANNNSWTVDNFGKGGASNDRSIRVVFDEINKNYDLIILAWTTYDRFEISKTNNQSLAKPIETINVNFNVAQKMTPKLDWAVEFYLHHNDRFYNYQKWLRQIIMMQSYLKQIGQKYLFCNTFGIMSDLREDAYNDFMPKLEYLTKQVDGKYYIGWPDMGMLDWMGDCSKGPGGHPLELGHQRIAERINEHIRYLGWIS